MIRMVWTSDIFDRMLVLKIAVRAMNNTISENGLVPSQLVFGVKPRLTIISTKRKEPKARVKIIARAQMEMSSIVTERKVEAALRKSTAKYTDHLFCMEDKALLYSENNDKWIRPFISAYVEGRMDTVRPFDDTSKYLFISFQVQPYFMAQNAQNMSSPSEEENGNTRHQIWICANSFLSVIHKNFWAAKKWAIIFSSAWWLEPWTKRWHPKKMWSFLEVASCMS